MVGAWLSVLVGSTVLPLQRVSPADLPGSRRLDEARGYGHRRNIYYVDVTVGDPGQVQSLIVDTGSSITAFPCTTTCESGGCGEHLDPQFNPEGSKTLDWLLCLDGRCTNGCQDDFPWCTYSISYSEGSSIQGYVFEDLVAAGHPDRGNGKSRALLGCHTRETNLFLTQNPTGIIGLNLS